MKRKNVRIAVLATPVMMPMLLLFAGSSNVSAKDPPLGATRGSEDR